jgi:Bacterial toxin 23
MLEGTIYFPISQLSRRGLQKWSVVIFLYMLGDLLHSQSEKNFPIDISAQFRIEFGNGHFGNAFSLGLAAGINKEYRLTPSTRARTNFQTILHFYFKGIGVPYYDSFISDSTYIREGSRPQFRKVQFDWINSISVTYGLCGSPSNAYRQVVRPIFPMAATIPTALRTNYYGLINVGTNFIINSNGRSQQTGFVGLGYDRVYLSYYNDGTPFQYVFLGDGRDRWWTGGGYVMIGSETVSATSWPDKQGNMYIVGFDKFTGYSLKSFEIANKLFLKYVPYAQGFEKVLNQSRFYGMFRNRNQLSLFFSLNDIPKLDIQNMIHDGGSMAKHLGYYKPTMSFGGIGIFNSSFFIR